MEVRGTKASVAAGLSTISTRADESARFASPPGAAEADGNIHNANSSPTPDSLAVVKLIKLVFLDTVRLEMLTRPLMLTIKNQAPLAWAILACGLLFSGCTPPGPRALLEGKKLLDQGKFELAIDRLRNATEILGDNAMAWNYLGLAYHRASQFGEAEKAYLKAISLNRDLSEAHYNIGCLFLAQNRLEQAKSEFLAFTLRRGNHLEGLVKLGDAQARLKEYTAADKSLSEALRNNPTNAEALNLLGLVRSRRGRPAEAMQLFAQALRQQPGYAPALLNQAVVAQENLRDYPGALRAYRAYLAAAPHAVNTPQVRTVIEQLERELAPRPISPPAQVAAADLAPAESTPSRPSASEREPVAKTEKRAEPVIVKPLIVPKLEPPPAAKPAAPTPPPAAPALQSVRLDPQPVIKAAQDAPVAATLPPAVEAKSFERSTPLTPTPAKTAPKRSFLQKLNPFSGDQKPPPPPLVNLAAASKAPLDIARPTMIAGPRHSYEHPPKPLAGNRLDAERALVQASQSYQAHRIPEAIQSYKRATQLDPSFFDAWYNLGVVASEAGNTPTAMSAYEHALAARPESMDARYNFALLLKQAGFLADSAAEFERILAIYPNESRSHLALGNLYAQQLKQPEKARAHYLKVLEIDPRNPQAAAIRYWLAEPRADK